MRRSRPFAWHRVLILGVLTVLVGLAFLGARGPAWFQRRYHPLAHREQIEAAALRHDINPYLIAAVINAESGFEADRTSAAGAVGLMQVMPDTAAELLRREFVSAKVVSGRALSDPGANIEYGTAYLRYLVNRYHEVETVLAAYNAGLRHADEWSSEGGNIREAIGFPETRAYVLKVVRAREQYEELYPDAFPQWKEANP